MGNACFYLFESVIDNSRQVIFRDLWEHLTDCTGNMILTSFFRHWAAMQSLPGRITFDLLLYPILPISGRGLFEATFFAILITELATCKLNNLEWEMVSYSVDVVGELLGVGVCFVLRLGLHTC